MYYTWVKIISRDPSLCYELPNTGQLGLSNDFVPPPLPFVNKETSPTHVSHVVNTSSVPRNGESMLGNRIEQGGGFNYVPLGQGEGNLFHLFSMAAQNSKLVWCRAKNMYLNFAACNVIK